MNKILGCSQPLGKIFRCSVPLFRGQQWEVRGGSCRLGVFPSLWELLPNSQSLGREAFVEEVTPELGFEG